MKVDPAPSAEEATAAGPAGAGLRVHRHGPAPVPATTPPCAADHPAGTTGGAASAPARSASLQREYGREASARL